MTAAALTIAEPGADLLSVEKAAALLRRTNDIGLAREIRNRAKIIQTYRREQRASLDALNDAIEVALRAERRLGKSAKR